MIPVALEDNGSLVSIVLTTYNSQVIIEQVLRAIVSQNFPLGKVELIIVDGGSKDKTLELIRSFLKENAYLFHDVKVIIHNKNYGVSKARNDGMKMSRGRYILILDHDVVMGRDVLKSLVEYLEISPKNVGVAKPSFHTVKGRLLDMYYERILKNKVVKVDTIADCALIKREVIEHVGYYDETLGPPHTICEEREYGARVEAKGYEIHSIGWVKVDHYQGIEENNANMEPPNQHVADNFLKKLPFTQLVVALKLLSDFRYRRALRKWIASMPSFKRLKWKLYSTIMPMLVITLFIALALETYIPLILWGFITSISYLDVLREYWNPKVLHISIVYSLIAFFWRVTRSLVLLTPK
jgi:glycosyltransferase involved in cell wall biosynthesis